MNILRCISGHKRGRMAVFILGTRSLSGRTWANICCSSGYASLVKRRAQHAQIARLHEWYFVIRRSRCRTKDGSSWRVTRPLVQTRPLTQRFWTVFHSWITSDRRGKKNKKTKKHMERDINDNRELHPFPFEWVLRALTDFTLSNARRFYSSMGNLLDGKGLSSHDGSGR